MKKNKLFIATSLFALLICSSCSVKDEIDDSIKRVDCLALLADFTDLESQDRTCAQIIADVDKITRECNQFLDEDTRSFLANAKANCSDN